MMAPRALACWRPARRVPRARTRLQAMAAMDSRAALAANFPDGQVRQGPSFQSAKTCSMTAWTRSCSSARGRRSCKTATASPA
jgi:hypothetical protein